MPEEEANNGGSPGANASAETNTGGKVENGKTTTTNPADNSEDKTKQVVFDSQEALDQVIRRRVDRAVKELKDKAELSETERLKLEAAEARREVIDRDLRDDFITEIGIEGRRGRVLFAAYKADLDVDEKTNKATNLKDVVKSIQKDFPELFSKSPAGGADVAAGGKGEAVTAGGMNDFLRRARR